MTVPAPRQGTRSARSLGAVFLLPGFAFLALGASTRQTAFLAIGPAFLVIGIAFLARARKTQRP
jgi:hypothetical protein